MKIAILGCGNIGSAVAEFLVKSQPGVELAGLFDIDLERSESLAKRLGNKVKAYKTFEAMMKGPGIDLVLEAASQEAVATYGPQILDSGKSMMVMSVGAFTNDALLAKMLAKAREKGLKVYVPSGAVAGVDGLKSANVGQIDSVTLTTRKNPKGLDVNVDKETVLYDGPAREGIRKYPKNVNVAATLSLAGIGLDRTRLRIVADPSVERNVHEIVVKGEFGEFSIKAENVPSRENPKTSLLAILSAMATLKKMADPLQIGT